MDIANRMRIVERPRELDDVVNVSRNRLIRGNECGHVLHARAHRINLQIDAALAIVVITLLIIGVLLAFTWPTRYRLVKENRYYKERYQIRQKIKAMRAERDGDIQA